MIPLELQYIPQPFKTYYALEWLAGRYAYFARHIRTNTLICEIVGEMDTEERQLFLKLGTTEITHSCRVSKQGELIPFLTKWSKLGLIDWFDGHKRVFPTTLARQVQKKIRQLHI